MKFGRRQVMGVAAAAAMVPFLPVHRARAAKTLKVGAYGGFFKDSFDANIFPDFTAATGVAIESVAEPTVEAWLVQLDAAVKAGQPTADVSMIALGGYLRSGAADLWVPIDLGAVPNAQNLEPHFIHYAADGTTVDGISAVAWYTTLVSNTEEVPVEPTTWAEMWDPEIQGFSRPSGAGEQRLPAGDRRGHLLRRPRQAGDPGGRAGAARQGR